MSPWSSHSVQGSASLAEIAAIDACTKYWDLWFPANCESSTFYRLLAAEFRERQVGK
jgi:hypothetical protein